jgi:hypothetical protein
MGCAGAVHPLHREANAIAREDVQWVAPRVGPRIEDGPINATSFDIGSISGKEPLKVGCRITRKELGR